MDTYEATMGDLGYRVDREIELLRAQADDQRRLAAEIRARSPWLPPVQEIPGHRLLLDRTFADGLMPPELSWYNGVPKSHEQTAAWHPSRARVENGILRLRSYCGGPEVSPTLRDRQVCVSAGGGLWKPVPGTPYGEATSTSWGVEPARAGEATGFKYGRVLIRARFDADVPSAKAPQMGGVFWLYPADDRVRWPGPEVDFLEYGPGDRQTITPRVHYRRTSDGVKTDVTPGAQAVDATQWHDYELEWTKDYLRGYIDGVLRWEILGSKYPDAIPQRHMVLGWQLEAFTLVPGYGGDAAGMHIAGYRIWEAL